MVSSYSKEVLLYFKNMILQKELLNPYNIMLITGDVSEFGRG